MPNLPTCKKNPHTFRWYTSDDYVNGVPCIYKWRDVEETVFPISLGGAHPFDDSRRLTFRFFNGHITTRNIDGSDLTTCLYAMVTPTTTPLKPNTEEKQKMSLTDKIKTLTEKTEAEQSTAAEKAKKNADLKRRIAEAYDRHNLPADFPEVHNIFVHTLRGIDAGLQFKDVTPENAVKIMEAFKPVASGLFKDTFVTYQPLFSLPYEWQQKHPSATYQAGDGYTLHIDRTADYPTHTNAQWVTEIGPALFVRVGIDFSFIDGVTPKVSAIVERHRDGDIKSVRDASIEWAIKPPFAIEAVRYASGSHKNFPPFLVWAKPTGGGSPMLAMVKEWATVNQQRNTTGKVKP